MNPDENLPTKRVELWHDEPHLHVSVRPAVLRRLAPVATPLRELLLAYVGGVA